jgi:RND family efflux transporter MFP subunit
VVAVRLENLPELTEITGTVRPLLRAQLAAKVMGAIEAMPVALGQRVRRGEPLVSISAGEIKARVAQAQAQLNQASRDLARERELLAKGASTSETVKDLEDRYAGAEAMLREAGVMLGYATIRAPFDGVVASKLANAGDLASPGLPLLEIEGGTGFEVEAGVPDSLAGALAVGMALTVQIGAEGVSFSGKLSEVSSAADPNAHTVTVKIAVPAGAAVRSGQFARIQMPGSPIRALLAPWAAVSTLGQMERVFVVGDENRLVLRLVKTGARRGDDVEILSGLDDGDRVVLARPAVLCEGRSSPSRRNTGSPAGWRRFSSTRS